MTQFSVAATKKVLQGDRLVAPTDPIVGGEAVTPADGADLANLARALYVGTTGDVKVDTIDGSTITFKFVPVGILPVQTKRVYATGTTASNIVALW